MIARAGYSAAMGTTAPQDTADIHFHDTVLGGDYMGNRKFLKAVCHKNVEATNALLKWGAAFRTGPDGRLDLGKVPNAGHTYPRAVRVAGEFSHIGKIIMDLLQPRIRERGIEVIGNVMVIRLLTFRGAVTGALGFDWRSGLVIMAAKSASSLSCTKDIATATSSTFPRTALLAQHYVLLQRNLLSTGVTRRKKLVVIIGTKKAMAIRNKKTEERYTPLNGRLAG